MDGGGPRPGGWNNQNICFEYSKEPSHWDSSFEHPKHMFKFKGKKIIKALGNIKKAHVFHHPVQA